MNIRYVDRTELEELAARPDVRPWVKNRYGLVDLKWIYEDPGIFVLGCEGVTGACVLIPDGTAYDVHLLAPDAGGIEMIKAVRDWVFANTGASAIVGVIPRTNLAARLAGRALGGVPVRTQIDDLDRPCIVYELTREQHEHRQQAC